MLTVTCNSARGVGRLTGLMTGALARAFAPRAWPNSSLFRSTKQTTDVQHQLADRTARVEKKELHDLRRLPAVLLVSVVGNGHREGAGVRAGDLIRAQSERSADIQIP